MRHLGEAGGGMACVSIYALLLTKRRANYTQNCQYYHLPGYDYLSITFTSFHVLLTGSSHFGWTLPIWLGGWEWGWGYKATYWYVSRRASTVLLATQSKQPLGVYSYVRKKNSYWMWTTRQYVHVYHILPAYQLEAAWNNRIEVSWFEHCKRFVFLGWCFSRGLALWPICFALCRHRLQSLADNTIAQNDIVFRLLYACLLQYSVSSEKENSRFSINLGNNLPCNDSYLHIPRYSSLKRKKPFLLQNLWNRSCI